MTTLFIHFPNVAFYQPYLDNFAFYNNETASNFSSKTSNSALGHQGYENIAISAMFRISETINSNANSLAEFLIFDVENNRCTTRSIR